MDIGEKHVGHILRRSAAKPSRDGNILPAVDTEGDRIALDRGTQLSLPECISSLDVHRVEDAVIIAHERNAAPGGQHCREEGLRCCKVQARLWFWCHKLTAAPYRIGNSGCLPLSL
jgi:hypothetical protein